MRKLKLTIIMLLLITTLAGCSLFLTGTGGSKSVKYEVDFVTNSDQELDSVFVSSDDTFDLNTTHIPEKEGHSFKGWFLDTSLSNPYTNNDIFTKPITLYASWDINTYSVNFYSDENLLETKLVEYNKLVMAPEVSKEKYTFTGWYEMNSSNQFDFDTLIINDLNLYAKYQVADGYIEITFETNGGTHLNDIVIPKSSKLNSIDEIENGDLIFGGWYLDPDYNNPFDINLDLTTDTTLYARWAEPHVIDSMTHTLNNDILSWEAINEAISYHIYLEPDSEDFIEVTNTEIDLRIYESFLLDPTLVSVYAAFEYNEVVFGFNAILLFDNQNIVYETDFEDESFPHQTSYNNNVNSRVVGPVGETWSIINGAISKTNAINGTKSAQLRWYTTTTNTPYIEMDFEVSNVDKIKFLGKGNEHNLKVLYYIDGVLSENTVEIKLSTVEQVFELPINEVGPIRFRFELIQNADESGKPILIDDVQIFSSIGTRNLIEIPQEEPESEEDILLVTKNRFEQHRARLAPPTFTNALSPEGLLSYYANLNGLSGNAFKRELENIIKNSHQRLVTYNEVRFILEQSDLVTDKDGNTYLDGIYSGHNIIRYWDGGATWAREHVWPNSRLGMDRVGASDRNQGSDAHNLRAINPSVNSSRSNRYFMNATTSANQLVGVDAYYPGDDYRGDVARILFYMVVRYPDILTLRDLDINVGDAYTQESAIMGILSTLLEWHELDPVDDFELRRNDIIYTYQGNRNPFIDNPEYALLYFN